MATTVRTAHVFIDGGYLLQVAREVGLSHYPQIGNLVAAIAQSNIATAMTGYESIVHAARTRFYDGLPDEDSPESAESQRRREFWQWVQLLPDTHLGFGMLKNQGPGKGGRKQKGVDTLIAVDMLVGAFNRLFDLAVLVAGDADFVPVLNEIRRLGPTVLLVAHEEHLAPELRAAADRFLPIVHQPPDLVRKHTVQLRETQMPLPSRGKG